jgi:hypothetical protein
MSVPDLSGTRSWYFRIKSIKNCSRPIINNRYEARDKANKKPYKKYDVNPKKYLSEFSNFVEEIVINKEYDLPIQATESEIQEAKRTKKKPEDSYGVEVFMFVNALFKNKSNMELRRKLKEIEITRENIFDPFPSAGTLLRGQR